MKNPPRENKLYSVNYRLTRSQIRKVEEMGGVPWLRELISKSQKSRHGRDPVAFIRHMKHRNVQIALDPRPATQLVSQHKLSVQRIRAIRRQYLQGADDGADPQ